MPYLAVFWGSRGACWRLLLVLSLGFHFVPSPSHRLSRLGCGSSFLEETEASDVRAQAMTRWRRGQLCHQPSERDQRLGGGGHHRKEQVPGVPFLRREVTAELLRHSPPSGHSGPTHHSPDNSPQRHGPRPAARQSVLLSWAQSPAWTQAAEALEQHLPCQDSLCWQRWLGQPPPGGGLCPGRARGCHGPSRSEGHLPRAGPAEGCCQPRHAPRALGGHHPPVASGWHPGAGSAGGSDHLAEPGSGVGLSPGRWGLQAS